VDINIERWSFHKTVQDCLLRPYCRSERDRAVVRSHVQMFNSSYSRPTEVSTRISYIFSSERNIFEIGICRGERESCFISSIFRVLIRCIKIIKQSSLLLWMWSYRHVSATYVNIFRVAPKLYDFNCVVIPTQYKYICFFALSTLKMATWVDETCRRSLYTKFTFIKLKCIFLVI